eukprot:2248290-Pleurochrysis_carterae.AAC.1
MQSQSQKASEKKGSAFALRKGKAGERTKGKPGSNRSEGVEQQHHFWISPRRVSRCAAGRGASTHAPKHTRAASLRTHRRARTARSN